jgi:hypothetical protein
MTLCTQWISLSKVSCFSENLELEISFKCNPNVPINCLSSPSSNSKNWGELIVELQRMSPDSHFCGMQNSA